jgi:hypothetical protein
MKTEINISHCSVSQIKANTGRNTGLRLLANINVFYPKGWSINERINYKAMYSHPINFYKEFWELAEIKIKSN